MLVIIVHSFGNISKIFCTQHPCIPQRIILIKNTFRETAVTAKDNLAPVDFDHQAPAVQNERSILFMVKDSGLGRLIIGNHLSHLHAVLMGQTVVTAHHIRAGFLRTGQHDFIHIRSDPVIAVDKSYPLSSGHGKPYIFSASLLTVYRRMHRPEPIRIFRFITPDYLPGIIRGAVIHRNDFHIPARLVHQGIQAVFQLSLPCRIINRNDYAQLHSFLHSSNLYAGLFTP